MPNGVFVTERWDPSTGLEMGWEFPVDVGTPVEVRLLFGESCGCANDPGERIFDVAVDGVLTLDDYDIMADADVPFQAGTMKAFRVVSDGIVDIDFTHVVENTEIRAVEIVELVDTATVPAGDVDFLTVVSNPAANGQAASLTDVVDSLNGPGLPGTPTSIAASCDLAIPGDLAPGTSTECRFTRTINGNPAELFSDVVDVTGAFSGGQGAAVMSGAVAITMTSLPPAAPAGLGAIDGDAVVDLDWTDTAGATGYNVYRGTAPGVTAGSGTLLTGTPATTSDFSDTTAVNGTIYYYVVTAVGAGGEGAESAEVSGHPLPNTAVLERINAGGGDFTASDGLQDWEADGAGTANHQWLSVPGTDNVGSFPVGGRDPSLPSYVPQGLFTSERYDGAPGSPDMTYAIPVTPGATVDLRLFMANGWPGSNDPTERQFDVTIEGVLELDEFDLSGTYGHQVGGMERFIITDDGDGLITIVFSHGAAQNPMLNAIEVRAT